MMTAKLLARTGAAIAAAFFTCAIGPGATAADLLAPAPMDAPLAEPLVEWGSGWCLRGDLGVSDDKRDPMMRLPGVPGKLSKRAVGLGADIGMGYQWNEMFRTDLTVGMRKRIDQTISSTYSCFHIPTTQSGACDETARTRIDRYPLMANAYLDLGTYGGLRPYVGAGAGVAFVKEKWDRRAYFNGSTPFAYVDFPPEYGQSPISGSKTRTNFAYALMAGVGYDLADGLTLDIGYRFLDMGKVRIPGAGAVNAKLREHEARIGLRYRID